MLEVQSISFPRIKYTTLECRQWLKLNRLYPVMRVDRTDTDYIYILSKLIYTHYKTKLVGNKIKICYGFF